MRQRKCAMMAIRAALALMAVCRLAGATEQRLVPSWMTVDTARHSVRLDIVSGWNADNGGLNFNGYSSGAMTVVVPLGWSVELAFRNADKTQPHSLVVTRAYGADDMPNVAGVDEAAIRRAYTKNPMGGIFAPGSDSMRFVAKTAGRFDLFCGAPGHGRAGMWTHFTVDAAASSPYVLIEDGADGRK